MPYLGDVRKVQHAGRPRVRRLAPECPKRASLRGEESIPASPRLSGNEAALWPEHDPGLTRRAPQGGHGAAAGSTAQPQRRMSGTPGGRGPEKRRFSTSGGRKGQGHSQERNSSPRGPVSEFGPFTSGHPLLWNFHPLSPGLAVGLGGMLGQAAGHRVLVRLESLTRLTCRLAPHLKRVWSAGSFGRSVEWEVTSSAASLAHEAE